MTISNLYKQINYTVLKHASEAMTVFLLCSYLRMNPLNVRVQVPLLGEGGRAQHAEVRFLPGVSHHVSL